jgi:hypothetical protein
VEKLEESLNEFRQQFQHQRRQLSQQEWFKTLEQTTKLLQEQSQTQIEISPKSN